MFKVIRLIIEVPACQCTMGEKPLVQLIISLKILSPKYTVPDFKSD